jgi:fused signal recognition particle receptor
MAGFFKKLFNRIVGKPDEESVPVAEVQVALPAPEPEPIAKVVTPAAKKLSPKRVTKPPAKPAPKATGKIAERPPKRAAARKLAPKKPEPKKTVPVKKTAPPPVVKAKIETKESDPPPALKPTLAPAPVVEAPARGGWFTRLKEGLSKSSKSITGSITAIFTKRKLDQETLQELEDTLIQADLGIAVSERIIAAVSHGRYDKEIDPEEVKQILASEVARVLKPVEVPFNFGAEKPFVILVVGVNGSGKTTTIGKLGSIAASEDYRVMFAACDTFRAAAVEQLTVWGERIGAVTKSAPIGADAAGLAFDALKQAREDGTDILFIDTAGRLQNKTYLMDELDKVVRVIKKMDPAAPHAVLLVLDATTGQNALAQAEIFTKVAGVTGLIMTKLDGTARGGILVAIAEKFKLPIHAIGVGESIDDLQPFDAEAFARAIAGFED